MPDGLITTKRRFRLPATSVRFRLTAWYALLLALVLVILGVSVLGLTRDRLEQELDERIYKTAADIDRGITSDNTVVTISPDGYLDAINVGLTNFAKRGLLIQIVNAHNDVVTASTYASRWTPLVAGSADGPSEPATETVRVGDEDVRVVRYPFTHKVFGYDAPITGAILVGEPLDDLYGTLTALRRTLLTTSIGGLALAVIGGWVLAGRALRPVDRVTATAAKIAAGNGTAASLATRLRVPGTGDEIARLASTFNAMLDRLQASFLTQQRFVADASHELRTPLTAIRGNVDVLSRQLAARRNGDADDDLVAALEDMQRESARMGRLLDDLLLLARSDATGAGVGLNGQPQPVRLDAVARDAARSASALVDGQVLSVVAPEPVTVTGDPDRLHQLLLILLDNAVRHTPAGRRITVEVPPPLGGTAHLVVRDEGEGIAPEHLPHVFDRFYRADGARGRATGGTGLGLAIARVIARGHGGEIAVASTPGQGSVFTVSLPIRSAVPVSGAVGAIGPG